MNDLSTPVNTQDPHQRHLAILNHEKANTHFHYRSVEDLLNNTKDLLVMINEHQRYQVPRLRVLLQYYLNNNVGIMTRPRRRNPHKSDARIPHSFAQYIADFWTGYSMGIPANVEYKDDDVNSQLKDFQQDIDVDALNSNLETSRSIYGRAYELQFRDTDDMDVAIQLPVFNTFMVYDKTIVRNELFGVYYVEDDGEYTIEIHTDEEVIYFNDVNKNAEENLTIRDRYDHHRGEVDIIEHVNNQNRMGDAENSIPLIDSYDAVQSDLTNFFNDTNEAKMLVTGNISDEMIDTDAEDAATGMRESDLLVIKAGTYGDNQPGQINVDYMQRSYDVAGSEALKKRLAHDIHKLSYTPNFNDEFFSNETSGVAIENKMHQSSQLAKKKHHLFKKALRKRYRMWAHYKKEHNEITEYDPRNLNITLHINMRTSFQDEIKAYVDAGGKISQKTLLELAPFIPNADVEAKRIAEEEASLPTEPNSSTTNVAETPAP